MRDAGKALLIIIASVALICLATFRPTLLSVWHTTVVPEGKAVVAVWDADGFLQARTAFRVGKCWYAYGSEDLLETTQPALWTDLP